MILNDLGITVGEAADVVLATVGMYATLLIVVRILGQRVLASMSSFDLVAVIAFGSVIGRAALGDMPRLGSGVVALVTLIVIQAMLGLARRTRFGERLVTNRPVLLMAGPEILEDRLAKTHVSRSDLLTHLRQAGVRDRSEVAAVVLESRGSLSVIRAGAPIAPELLDGVVGAEAITGRGRA
ncbi:DUF421 domain-containing protein [Tsukamurella pulmonis]|uniref:DUF421 domain-containing protein n=1 Tax=Tsukamurella pulmonis TaxID=47312 RepID=UPI000AA0DE11|nr:YetF domain-containing protein [Tsukamurella pulmonis]RDH09491.1 DUF421 domain-containing protein [Tsukamurella pulmonis]